MPNVAPIQTNFAGGEFSPSLIGRVDAERYKSSLATCLNYIPLLQGPLDGRPGTYFVKEVKTSSKKTRLVVFKFSTAQAYILEFGEFYIRFYANYGQVLSGFVPLEVVTPYDETNIPFLGFTQSADVLYITGINYRPMKLERRSATGWTLTPIDFQDGPYLPTNTSQSNSAYLAAAATTGRNITLAAPSVTNITNAVASPSGEVRITAVGHGFVSGMKVVIAGVGGTVEANSVASPFGNWKITVIDQDTFDLNEVIFVNAYTAGGTAALYIFDAQDVGRLIRFKATAVWGWAKIVTVNSFKSVQVDIYGAFDGAAVSSTAWRLGVWSTLTGYPSCCVFHEDRLCFAGNPAYPQRIDMSRSSNYENFAPTETNGTVQDDNAVSFNLNSNDVNSVRWIASDEKGMVAGTNAGEWIVRPSVNSEAITPTNISAKKTTSWGSQNAIAPFQVGKATLFVQLGGKKLRELLFYFDVDGYRATDLTELAEHISGAGFRAIGYQKIPQSIVWLARADGALIGMTYERDSQNLRAGWHRHFIGGYSDAARTSAIVESIAVIPSPDGTRDDVWMIVKRYINGGVKRYVEYMSKFFEDSDLQEDCHFLDCGLQYDLPLVITGITKANPAVVTAPVHGLANGDNIVIRAVKGMTEVNYKRYVVANAAANTFELKDSDGNNIDSTAFTTYVSSGFVRKLISTISGLSHLEGETVSVLADGAVQTNKVVAGGIITLDQIAATVHVGYGYNMDARLLRQEAGSATGTSIGKTRRMTRAAILLHRSLGLKVGRDENNLDEIDFRTDQVVPNNPPPLFTGIKDQTVNMDYDYDNMLFLRQDQPLPSKILAIATQLQTQDRT